MNNKAACVSQVSRLRKPPVGIAVKKFEEQKKISKREQPEKVNEKNPFQVQS